MLFLNTSKVMLPAHYIHYLLRKNLQHLILHVTSRCNYECGHCFAGNSRQADMSVDVFRELGKQAGNLFWLDIGGGEPFLRHDLAEIVVAFRANVIAISSNGTMDENSLEQIQEIRRKTKAELCISLSVDGLEDTHDRIRNAPGSWKRVWDTYKHIRKMNNVSVKINTVLSNENVGEIIALMKFIRSSNPDFHSIILLRGNPRDPGYSLPSHDVLVKITSEMFKILSDYDYGRSPVFSFFLSNYHKYLWEMSLGIIRQKRQIIPCLAGRAHMVVMADGSVSPCELLPPVGNIGKQSLEQIIQGDGLKEQIDLIRQKRCYCTHNCTLLDSIIFNPASIPHVLFRRILK